MISHGFTLEEAPELAELAARSRELFDGVVLRIPRSSAPVDAAVEAGRLAQAMGKTASLYFRTNSSNPAEPFFDDAANAVRTAAAIAAATAVDGVEAVLDNFADNDRSYFARSGLVDRRFNPRRSGEVVRHLISVLDGETWRLDAAAPGAMAGLRSASGKVLALLDAKQFAARGTKDLRGGGDWIDLADGTFLAAEDVVRGVLPDTPVLACLGPAPELGRGGQHSSASSDRSRARKERV